MATWDELNKSAGGQASQAPKPSAQQTGGWASANAQAKQSAPVMSPQKTIEQAAIASRPANAAVPFISGAVITAPQKSTKKLGLEGVTINRPTSLYGTESGGPIIDIDPDKIKFTTTEESNFIQRGLAAGLNAVTGSVMGISRALGELFTVSIVDTQAKREEAAGKDSSQSLLPELRQRVDQGMGAKVTTPEKIAAVTNVVTGVANASFTPVAAQLEVARELPVVGKPIFGTILKGFELLDHASRFVGSKVVDVLPIDEQAKSVLRQPIEDLAGIVGTLFGVKAVHVAGKNGGGRVVDALPVSSATKGQIRAGVQLGANVALEPFSTAYQGITSAIRTKVDTRRASGEEITPDVAKVIVNEAVKEVNTPDIQAIMEVPTPASPEKPIRVVTNQKLVLENLIKGREDLNYKLVKDLGTDLKTGEPITARFEWDRKNQQGTIYTTNKTTALDLSRELGHYVDRQLGAALSTRFSDILPDYVENRDQINQMLADYAIDRLGGDATHQEINAEILRIAENVSQEVRQYANAENRKRPAQQFASAFGNILDDPASRKGAPELARLASFSLGNVARKGIKADVEGEAGSVQEKRSMLDTLEGTKKAAIKDVRTNDEGFARERLDLESKREALEAKKEAASGDFSADEAMKAIRNSREFRKEKSITDATINGFLMEKNGRYQLARKADVADLEAKGWTKKADMDVIASDNGFENAEDYVTYLMELDAETRSISRSPEQKAAHEYLLKNDENYANLNKSIEKLREELAGEEITVPETKQASPRNAEAVPRQKEVETVAEVKVNTKLPRELAGAKPRYGYRDKQFTLKFESDLDRAAYITAQANPSGRDADYLAFVMDATNMTEAQVRARGAEIRAGIKEIARDADPGEIVVSDSQIPVKKVSKPAPAAEPVNEPAPDGFIELYRGMSQKFDSSFDLTKTDAPNGYSTWTDSLELAKQYAGENGYVYKITLPESKRGMELVDAEGERVLFLNNEKKAGLNNVSGDEYLVYNQHDDYSPSLISEVKTSINTPRPRKETVAGERGESSVGKSIARKTIEQKLEDSYAGVAGYEKINIKDQARQMDDLINNDLDRAKRIMIGEEPLPDGLRAGAVIKAMEEYALRTGDADLAFELANSPLVSETSVHAQEMRLLAERSPDSATAQLQAIKKARTEAAEKRLQAGETLNGKLKKAKSELNEAVKKSRPTKENWSSFIESIKC
jgi:hypothetical protein